MAGASPPVVGGEVVGSGELWGAKRERERTGREEREGKGENKRNFPFLKTPTLQNYLFAPTFLEP